MFNFFNGILLGYHVALWIRDRHERDWVTPSGEKRPEAWSKTRKAKLLAKKASQ